MAHLPGGNIQRIAAAQPSDGAGKPSGAGLIAFALDVHGRIWETRQAKPGAAWGEWRGVGSGNQPMVALDIAAAGQNDGKLALAALDESGMVWLISQSGPNNEWGDWAGPGFGGQIDSFQSIAAAEQGGPRGIEIWATDLGGNIWTLYQQIQGGRWSDWEGPGFAEQKVPMVRVAAAPHEDLSVVLIGLDTNETVAVMGQDGPGGHWSNPWYDPAQGGQPSKYFHIAAARQGGHFGTQLWSLDEHGQLWTCYQFNVRREWTLWDGPGFKDQPGAFLHIAAAGLADGPMTLLAVDRDGNLMSIRQSAPASYDWGPWIKTAGPPTVALSAVDAPIPLAT
jgi:hypothetical protein